MTQLNHPDPFSSERRSVPGSVLLHIYPGLAFLLVVINDWYLKKHWAGWWSGKLSDVGLCFLLPIVLVALYEWCTWGIALLRNTPGKPAPPKIHTLACIVAATYFSLLQIFPAWSRFHTLWLQVLVPSRRFVATPDLTDLLALPMVYWAWIYLQKQTQKPKPKEKTCS